MSGVKASWVVLLVGLGGPVLAQPLDATVETTRGGAVQLAALWGKPVVVFYEDKDGTGQNQPLKEELEAQLARIRSAISSSLPGLNNQLKAAAISPIIESTAEIRSAGPAPSLDMSDQGEADIEP